MSPSKRDTILYRIPILSGEAGEGLRHRESYPSQSAPRSIEVLRSGLTVSSLSEARTDAAVGMDAICRKW